MNDESVSFSERHVDEGNALFFAFFQFQMSNEQSNGPLHLKRQWVSLESNIL